MATDLARIVDGSNLPARSKSTIRSYLDRGVSGSKWLAERRPRMPAHGMVREGLESAMTGAVLGGIAKGRAKGLDVTVGPVTMPADLLLAAAGLAVGALTSSAVSQDGRAVGNAALAVYAYRRTGALVTSLGFAAAPTTKIAGEDDSDEDPLVAAARNL